MDMCTQVAVLERHSRHPNIARFFGSYRKRADSPLVQDELWLVIELCAFGSAYNLVDRVRDPRKRKEHKLASE